MRYIYLVVLACTMLTSCATMKNIGRTTNDIARALCSVFAAENEDQLQGFSPDEWCAVHENLQPFVEYIVSAKQAAGAAALGIEPEDE